MSTLPPPVPPVPPGTPPVTPGGSGACPYCGPGAPIVYTNRVSTAGWVVFAVLICFCPPLFWIGLLMKERIVTCGGCGARLG